MSLPRHRKPTQAEVVADLRERLDILQRKAAAVSEAWDLFIEDESGSKEWHDMVENTTQRDPAMHLLGALSEGPSGYIEGMEAAGQRQLVGSTKLPTDAPWDEMEALGFVRGADVPGDDLFCEATLPAGWRREASDHAMWSHVLDERGVRRLAVFYKAAFYDRKAGAHLECPGSALATDVLYGDEPVALPAMWDVLTEDERADFWADVEYMVQRIAEHPSIYGKYQPRVDVLLALR